MDTKIIEHLKNGEIFYLENRGSNKYVTAYESEDSALHALSNDITELCYFKFERHEKLPNTYYLFTWKYRNKITVIGKGWPLFPKTSSDKNCHLFSIHPSPFNETYICLKFEYPTAQGTPWISVIGESRILRVSEKIPRKNWSEYLPRLVNI